jgi:hypothetical protein
MATVTEAVEMIKAVPGFYQCECGGFETYVDRPEYLDDYESAQCVARIRAMVDHAWFDHITRHNVHMVTYSPVEFTGIDDI